MSFESLNAEGRLPYMGEALSEAEREDWRMGWKYEELYFDGDITPPLLSPHLLPAPLREFRRTVIDELHRCLLLTCTDDQLITQLMEQQVAAMDLTVLSDNATESQRTALEQMLSDFSSGLLLEIDCPADVSMDSPSTWFLRYARDLPSQMIPEDIDLAQIFLPIAYDGGFSNTRPSVVAAAVLVFLLGEEAAEDHICGYDLCDLYDSLYKLHALFGVE